MLWRGATCIGVLVLIALESIVFTAAALVTRSPACDVPSRRPCSSTGACLLACALPFTDKGNQGHGYDLANLGVSVLRLCSPGCVIAWALFHVLFRENAEHSCCQPRCASLTNIPIRGYYSTKRESWMGMLQSSFARIRFRNSSVSCLMWPTAQNFEDPKWLHFMVEYTNQVIEISPNGCSCSSSSQSPTMDMLYDLASMSHTVPVILSSAKEWQEILARKDTSIVHVEGIKRAELKRNKTLQEAHVIYRTSSKLAW